MTTPTPDESTGTSPEGLEPTLGDDSAPRSRRRRLTDDADSVPFSQLAAEFGATSSSHSHHRDGDETLIAAAGSHAPSTSGHHQAPATQPPATQPPAPDTVVAPGPQAHRGVADSSPAQSVPYPRHTTTSPEAQAPVPAPVPTQACTPGLPPASTPQHHAPTDTPPAAPIAAAQAPQPGEPSRSPVEPAPPVKTLAAKHNVAALVSLICGIIGLLTAIIIIGLLPSLVGIIAGFIGLKRSRSLPQESSRKKMAIAGIVLSCLGFVAPFVIVGGTFIFLGTDTVDKIGQCNVYNGQDRTVCIQAVLDDRDPAAAVDSYHANLR